MFKLIKLAVYGLLGYALYEFFRGISTQSMGSRAQSAGQGGPSGMSRAGQGNSRSSGAGNAQWSGPGEGQQMNTEEASGEGVPHRVGRGVVSH